MTNTKATKRALLLSVMAMLVCVAMLVGTTFAWFTDSASTAVNKIQAGTLDIQLLDESGASLEGQTLSWKKASGAANETVLWEPGCTYELQPIVIKNNGTLALKYKIVITGIKGDAELNNAIEWTITNNGQTYAVDQEVSLAANASATLTIKGHMKEDAGNEYQGLSIDGIGITVVATQYTHEHDSNDDRYDETAVYPAVPAIVKAIASGKVTNASVPTTVADTSSAVKATIPAGTLAENDNVVLTVERKALTADSVTYDIDLKVNNATPTLTNPVSVNVNIGAGLKDVVVTHNGNSMNKVENAVNDQEYSYNSETGILTIVTASFSPFAIKYKADFAAKIGNIGYATLGDAVAAAKQNDVIYLLKDITLAEDIVTPAQLAVSKDNKVIFDLAGHIVTSKYEGISIANYGDLTINDSSASKTGIVHNICTTNGNGNYGHDAVRNFGVLTINGGTFGDNDLDRTNANTEHRGASVRNQADAVCVINGGFFTCGDNYYTWGTGTGYSYAIRNYGDMTINNGTVYGAMNGGIAADGGQITINNGDFSLRGNNTFYVLVTGSGKIKVNDGTFTRTGANRLLGGFNGMPSWDATDDLEGNGYIVNGGTFVLNGESVSLPKSQASNN